MGQKTRIEWADSTWNPVTGCTKVTSGCDHCYAETIARRFTGTSAYPHGFTLTLRPDRLQQPLRWQRPRHVFVNSMSDVFHADIPTDYIARMVAVMALADRHDFLILTKRHARLRSVFTSPAFHIAVLDAVYRIAHGDDPDVHLSAPQRTAYLARHDDAVSGFTSSVFPWPLPNVWLGVSAEDQATADMRIPALLATPAARRFVSCEPLLGPVTLTSHLTGCTCAPADDGEAGGAELRGPVVSGCPAHDGLHWLIAGGESGPAARPMQPRWVRGLRDECVAADVPFFFKQWGEWGPVGDGQMFRMNKRLSGRRLDGRTWDQRPTSATRTAPPADTPS